MSAAMQELVDAENAIAIEKRNEEIALRMISLGEFSLEAIAISLDLPIDKVKELAASQQNKMRVETMSSVMSELINAKQEQYALNMLAEIIISNEVIARCLDLPIESVRELEASPRNRVRVETTSPVMLKFLAAEKAIAIERVREETALEMISDGELTVEEIAKVLDLPIDKVKELAASQQS